MVLRAVQQHDRLGDLGQIGVDQPEERPHGVRGVQRHPVVADLLGARQRDVAGQPLRRPHQMAGHGQGVRREAVDLVRRVHQHQARDLVPVLRGEAQRQGTAHREAEDEDLLAPGPQHAQLPVHLRVPVLPARDRHVLPARAVPGQQREGHGQSALRQIIGPGAQGLRRTRESVTEEDADLSALVAERLGSREDRHRGLLFMKRAGVRGVCKRMTSPYATGPTPTRAVTARAAVTWAGSRGAHRPERTGEAAAPRVKV